MQKNSVFDWNDPIIDEKIENSVLEEDDYEFTVTQFTRDHFPGSTLVPPCPKAVLTLSVDNPKGGVVNIRVDLMLCKLYEVKLCAFFRSIGLKKRGEAFQMDWSKVLHSTGKAHIIPKTFTTKDGREITTNAVKLFLDKDDDDFVEAREDTPFL